MSHGRGICHATIILACMYRALATCITVFSLLISTVAHAQSDPAVDSALRQIRQIQDDSLRLDALFAYNKTLWTTKPDQTIPVIRVGLADARKVNSTYFIAKSYSALGYAYLQAHDFPRSLQYFLQALSIWRQRGDYTRQVETLLYIANVHTKNEAVTEARKYATEAVNISLQHGVTSLEAKAYNELGITYEKSGAPQQAIALYEKGLAAAKREQDVYFETFLLGNIATSYRTLRQYDRALQAFEQVEQIGDTLGADYIIAVASYNLADLHLEMGNTASSERYVRRALASAEKVQDAETITASYGLLKRIALGRGDYKAALEYFEKQVAIRDTVFNQEKSAQLAEMQTRYDTELKDRKIDQQQLALSLNRRTTLFMGIGIALLAAIGVWIWLQQRRTVALNRKIALQNAQLEQLHGVKDRIFSVISHDMRTPVNSLLAFMQLLEEEGMPQEKLAAYGAELKTGMTDTATLLENLLDWAKSQMQGYKPVPERLNMAERIAEASRLLQPTAQQKNITIAYHPKHSAPAMADRQMTGIVLRNLLHNAIKYAPAHSEVHIYINDVANGVQITILDKGAGVPASVADAVNADSFAQPLSSTAGTAQEAGTGLGLMLCTTFIRQMQGSLHLEALAEGGTRCTVTLPAA